MSKLRPRELGIRGKLAVGPDASGSQLHLLSSKVGRGELNPALLLIGCGAQSKRLHLPEWVVCIWKMRVLSIPQCC